MSRVSCVCVCACGAVGERGVEVSPRCTVSWMVSRCTLPLAVAARGAGVGASAGAATDAVTGRWISATTHTRLASLLTGGGVRGSERANGVTAPRAVSGGGGGGGGRRRGEDGGEREGKTRGERGEEGGKRMEDLGLSLGGTGGPAVCTGEGEAETEGSTVESFAVALDCWEREVSLLRLERLSLLVGVVSIAWGVLLRGMSFSSVVVTWGFMVGGVCFFLWGLGNTDMWRGGQSNRCSSDDTEGPAARVTCVA